MKQIIFVLLLLPSTAFAWDPYPYPLPIEQTVQSSSCVYVGTVEKAAVTNITKSTIKAVVQIKVDDCVYGQDCKIGQVVEYTYLAQTVEETYLPASFPVGNSMLIALKSGCSAKHDFISRPVGSTGIDEGYVCPVLPFSIKDLGEKEVTCTDNIFNKKTTFVYSLLKTLANKAK